MKTEYDVLDLTELCNFKCHPYHDQSIKIKTPHIYSKTRQHHGYDYAILGMTKEEREDYHRKNTRWHLPCFDFGDKKVIYLYMSKNPNFSLSLSIYGLVTDSTQYVKGIDKKGVYKIALDSTVIGSINFYYHIPTPPPLLVRRDIGKSFPPEKKFTTGVKIAISTEDNFQ